MKAYQFPQGDDRERLEERVAMDEDDTQHADAPARLPPGQANDSRNASHAASSNTTPNPKINVVRHYTQKRKYHKRKPSSQRSSSQRPPSHRTTGPVYGALDLGTNNCRLLMARPTARSFRVVDSYSSVIRLGEGLGHTGRLSEPAMKRTINALKICAAKMDRQQVAGARLIATEACRIAENADEFIGRVKDKTGLQLEVVSRKTEARLAVSGCASLLDSNSDWALVFDIGGGSSELVWLDLSRRTRDWSRSFSDRMEARNCIDCWTSLPVGVVTLGEKFGGRSVTPEIFEDMVAYVSDLLMKFEKKHSITSRLGQARTHLLGTSGTVTTIAGQYLGLPCYDRRQVDGCWMNVSDVRKVSDGLVHMSYKERVAQPCIGTDRADLVLAGCAILEALLRLWPSHRIRVADRGLREGILATLMASDGYCRDAPRRRSDARQ